MQHLKEFLNSKRLPVKEILCDNICEISEKLDGNAFQVYTESNKIVYAKRSNAAHLPSRNVITEFDLVMSELYSDTVSYLSKFENILSNYKIINFEIFGNASNHIVNYGERFADGHGIVLLSAYDKDGTLLDYNLTLELAYRLGVLYNGPLYTNFLTEEFVQELIDNKDNDHKLWELVSNKCFPFSDDAHYMEGLVLNFKNDSDTQARIVKVQNPDFQEKIMKHLDDEKNNKVNINLEFLYDMFINKHIVIEESDECLLTKLLKMYVACEIATTDFTEVEKLLGNIDVIKQQEINILLAQKYYYMLPNKEDLLYPSLLTFILLAFRGKRTKFPMWCSVEYQLNQVNPFIDQLANIG